MRNRNYCDIGPIRSCLKGGVQRVEAKVCGHKVWFESTEVALRPSAEAFGSCFFIPALQARYKLRFHDRLSPRWRANVEKLLGIFHQWWDYPEKITIESEGDSILPEKVSDGAQCFSGGCDSFYTLLKMNHKTRYLVFVHGFDISYRDSYRMRIYRHSFEEICRATGKIPIVIRTNLRKHPFFRKASWENTHGSALAAIGHLLSDIIGRLVIASSYPYAEARPCGSHWDTDPLWASENIELIHDDATLYRLNKLQTMSDHPLVQQYLRVCYLDQVNNVNCSRCDKCVRTMLLLYLQGQLHNYPGFDQQTPLTKILDSMAPQPEWIHGRYEDLIRDGLPADIEAAIRRLLARQQPPRYWRTRRTYNKVKVALARAHLLG